MESNPQKRITIDGIKKHVWFLGDHNNFSFLILKGSLPTYEEVAAEMRKRGEIILIQNQEKFRNYQNKKLRKTKNLNSKHSLSGFRTGSEFEVENIKQTMQSIINEINQKLRRESEERALHKIMAEKSDGPTLEKKKGKGRRRSSDLKLTKEKSSPSKFVGNNGPEDDQAKTFLYEPCVPEDNPSMKNRKFPMLRKDSSKEDRIRIRRSGSDD